MTKYQVSHSTIYNYAQPVSLCHNEAFIIPKKLPWQNCQWHQLSVQPTPSLKEKAVDVYGNEIYYFSVQRPHEQLEVKAVSFVETSEVKYPKLDDSPPWQETQKTINKSTDFEILQAREFLIASSLVPTHKSLADYARPFFEPSTPVLKAVFNVMEKIFNEFEFDSTATTITSPVLETFENRKGVCQDFAHLAIGCMRSIGLPARYVSGYIETTPPPGQPKMIGADASHAWFSVFVPNLGWIDFDPTNNQLLNDQYITVAWGRDYSDVTPLKGVTLGNAQHTLEIAVDISRIIN